MPIVWSILLEPVGAGIVLAGASGAGARVEGDGVGEGEVGITTSEMPRSGADETDELLGAEAPENPEGGGITESLGGRGAAPLAGRLGGAKESSLLLCKGWEGGGGRKGVLSEEFEGSATMMVGT